jgi:large subunit ribosomal protein LP0
MPAGDVQARKVEYFEKLAKLLAENRSIFLCNVDNVGSNQMHQIRISLRGQATVLMGKNTMVRKVIRTLCDEHPEYERLLPLVRGNVGFVFTNGDLKEVRDKVISNRVSDILWKTIRFHLHFVQSIHIVKDVYMGFSNFIEVFLIISFLFSALFCFNFPKPLLTTQVRAPAKAGAVAPVDVFVPAGNTGMEPGKTSFFQALGIPTKIARGTIEIVSDVHLIKAGLKVGPSEATLLNMLNISPFTYGLSVTSVYDSGNTFDPSVLDITDDIMMERLAGAIKEVACLSLALHHPSIAAVPHLIINGYKDLVGISLATDYCIEQVKEVRFWCLADILVMCKDEIIFLSFGFDDQKSNTLIFY